MRNFIWSFSLFICVVFASFAQTKKIEPGTYLSNNKGSKIKLNLLDNKQFELVFYSGKYEIKGDSLLLKNEKPTDVFDLTYSNDKSIKSKKVKVKFIDAYYSFYLGTQNGTQEAVYQKATIDADQTNAELEIDRSDYIYLVYEGYDGISNISKYSLPKDINTVVVKYSPNLMGDLNISGYLNPTTNQLTLGEPGGKNPLVFQSEKEAGTSVSNSAITPLESQTVANWTYPGKKSLLDDDFGTAVAVDTVTTPAVVDSYPESKIDFKFKIENTLKEALASTKNSGNKLLIVYTDSKNPSAKADFDSFLNDQEIQLKYNMYSEYDPKVDVFNYYLATENDKKWLKANKIMDSPSVIVLNNNGDILAVAKSRLSDNKSELNYYYNKFQRVNAFYSFNKVIKNKKATDADLILAFHSPAMLELSSGYESESADDASFTGFKMTQVALDKKEVSQIWKKRIEAHQKDTEPNRMLVETILKEIDNKGFYKQFFNEDRVLNDTDFLSIDYLLKHYDAIEKMNIEDEKGAALILLNGSLSAEISSALQQNLDISEEGVSGNANQNRTITVYKKLIAAGKGSLDCYKNYFAYLSSESEKAVDDSMYLKEFNSYFNTYLSTEKRNPIERLDEMFAALDSSSDYSYNGWTSFKDYHSNLANSAAWTVVLKPANAGFIKDAIKWSEYSLIVTKNNPYYLDTLAQLYYKDGQKEKAIKTQELAVKFLNPSVEELTTVEIRETLAKMQNGTY